MSQSKVFDLIEKEALRQKNSIELIASENFVSENVLKAVGSILTNKYTEGYPAKREMGSTGRYYGGCSVCDELEEYCVAQWKKVFHTDYHVNVQPHSGSSANLAAYMSVLEPGDTILAMRLSNGGHLTHGAPVNFSGKLYKTVFYNVTDEGYIDYEDIREKVFTFRPALVLAGASAYSRIIDFQRIKNILLEAQTAFHAQGTEYAPWFMVDMAHIAGLIAGGEHPSPFGYADIITTTTHKTLRGPRGGMIFCRPVLAKKVDSAVFPCTQGGPLQHVIAGKAVAAEEAQTEDYKAYIQQVVKNTKAMCLAFQKNGFEIVTGGTDNHLFLVDLSKTHPHLTGKLVQDTLDQYGITLNKNCVPNENRSPVQTSGVRIGLAAMTTRGWKEADAEACADRIAEIINGIK